MDPGYQTGSTGHPKVLSTSAKKQFQIITIVTVSVTTVQKMGAEAVISFYLYCEPVAHLSAIALPERKLSVIFQW